MNRLLPRHAVRLRLPLPLRTTRLSHTFTPGPAPPKLPASEQAEFERLQRKASSPTAFQPDADAAPAAQPDGPLRGAPPEFQGDTNPKTGEVGGPKNEPLRWGGAGDWSYNGRVTDF